MVVLVAEGDVEHRPQEHLFLIALADTDLLRNPEGALPGMEEVEVEVIEGRQRLDVNLLLADAIEWLTVEFRGEQGVVVVLSR